MRQVPLDGQLTAGADDCTMKFNIKTRWLVVALVISNHIRGAEKLLDFTF